MVTKSPADPVRVNPVRDMQWIRCIMCMAENPEKMFAVNDIAHSQLIPKGFLAKTLQKFARAGLLRSSRGATGGFRLAKKPEEINLLEIIEVIEGSVAMNQCAINKRMCDLSDTCSIYPVWVEIKEIVEKRLRNISFTELISG